MITIPMDHFPLEHLCIHTPSTSNTSRNLLFTDIDKGTSKKPIASNTVTFNRAVAYNVNDADGINICGESHTGPFVDL